MLGNVLSPTFNGDVTLIALALLVGGIALWWFSGNRFLQAAGILIAVPGVAGVAMYCNGELRKERFADRTLQADETVGGVKLRAGTKIKENYRWMPGSARILVGVNLARNEEFDGLFCKAGAADFREGKPAGCVLTKASTIRGVTLPAGTRVSDLEGVEWSLELRGDTLPLHVALAAPGVAVAGFMIPAGSSLKLRGNPPRVRTVGLPQVKDYVPSIVVQGVKMITAVYFYDHGMVEGRIDEDAVLDGTLQKRGDWVKFRVAERVAQ